MQCPFLFELIHFTLADVNPDGNICVSVAALIQRAWLISGISGEGQMPRQNRLEVTPPPARAHSGPNKGWDHGSGCIWERGDRAERCYVSTGASFTHLASNNTPPRQNVPLHACEVPAHSGLSVSSEAPSHKHVPSLSRKTVGHYQVSCQTWLHGFHQGSSEFTMRNM